MSDTLLQPPPPTSLRERKKAKTRAALIEVSQRLFADRGYTATTLEDICAEVEIRPQTLLRYFDSKARLALAPTSDPLEHVQAVLGSTRRDVPAIQVWREFLRREAAEAETPTSGVTVSYLHNARAGRKWVDRDQALVAVAADIERTLRTSLAAALAADRGQPPDDLHSTLVAALLVSGRLAVWNRWLDDPQRDGSILDDQLAVVRYTVTNLPLDGLPPSNV
jgi:AcrR family transcriptional regulator